MSISANVSLLAQSIGQAARLNELRVTMNDLQRQVTTQKKFETYSGFGADSFSLQRMITTQTMTKSYLGNIDKVVARMTMQDKSMNQILETVNQLIHAIHIELQGQSPNMQSVRQQAQQGLTFIEDLLNQEMDGRYLFAGSNVTSQPFINDSALNSNFASQVALWLGGGQTTAQMITATDGFAAASLGLSPGLAAAGTVTARIDDNLDIDYTINADNAGFKDMLRAFAMVANLEVPDPTVDIATPQDFSDVVDHVLTVLSRGREDIKDISQSLASKFNLVKTLKERHESDLSIITAQVDEMENADPATAITSMQALQTQLTASYQVTRSVSQMSLTNFL